MKKTIAIVAAESVPFVKVGGLADVAGALFKKFGRTHNTALFLPYYRKIKDGFPARSVASFAVPMGGDRAEPGEVFESAQYPGAYFIANDALYDRPELYVENGREYPDNCERFAFFARAVIEACDALKLDVDIFHCNDWHTALLPLYLEEFYRRRFPRARTVFTIHNLAYQGVFPPDRFPGLGLDWSFFQMEELEFYGNVNLMKAGLLHADVLNTVSPQYAREILHPEFGCRLEGVLNKRRDSLFGIINGIDYQVWSPSFDESIAQKYRSPAGKAVNKAALQKKTGLAAEPRAPLFGFVGRLVEQKGVDYITGILDEVLNAGAQMVILGDGDPQYRDLLASVRDKHPDRLAVTFGFNDELAHLIYAACDFFLMPSRFEPCGLGQMIALKYGAIPIVKRVGGLADTVREYSSAGDGWGFTFEGEEDRFLAAVRKGLQVYSNPAEWTALVAAAMRLDYSWKKSSEEYLKLYDLAAGKT